MIRNRPKEHNVRKWKSYKAKLEVLQELERFDDFIAAGELNIPRMTGQQVSQILSILERMGFVERVIADKGSHLKAWRLIR